MVVVMVVMAMMGRIIFQAREQHSSCMDHEVSVTYLVKDLGTCSAVRESSFF